MSSLPGGDKLLPMSCRQGGDKTTTYVLPTRLRKLLPMSCQQGGDKTTTYVFPTRWRQNYYLCLTNKVEKTTTYINVCLTDKVETKLLPMSYRQGGDKTTTYVSSTRESHNYYRSSYGSPLSTIHR